MQVVPAGCTSSDTARTRHAILETTRPGQAIKSTTQIGQAVQRGTHSHRTNEYYHLLLSIIIKTEAAYTLALTMGATCVELRRERAVQTI